ncbi:MAG TPA: phosphoglycerate mutase family protein [Flavobacterium sp.]|jgi:broad specificity phosphatase PhoE
MKIYMHIILLAILATVSCSSDDDSQPSGPSDPEPVQTTIYLIRHAEKADNSANPNLSAEGVQRANNWAVILQDVAFDAFYSTNYNRTLQTIQPAATSNDKEVTLYDPANFSLDNVIANHAGKNVFIVGHSNTIPQLINSYLEANIYPDMAENEFGNLYKVTIVDGVVSHGMTVHN